jgi:hypothetical protein
VVEAHDVPPAAVAKLRGHARGVREDEEGEGRPHEDGKGRSM